MKTCKITVPELRARKRAGPKIAAVTAYDATMARLLDDGGADILLVGDSLGMVVQGLPNTLGVTLQDMCYHGRAVSRGARRAHVVGDMPFMSFQVSPERALDAAGKLLKDGAVEAVKLEGGVTVAEQVRRIAWAGIPVMGHVGLTPQSVHAMGGFRVQGRAPEAAACILQDAQALEQAGVYAIVLEGLPASLARRITQSVQVPTIGIGAGPHCDGQVLVCYDLLGMVSEFRPKFVKRFAELGTSTVEAIRAYVHEVQSGTFPDAAHSFGMSDTQSSQEPAGSAPVVGSAPSAYAPASDDDG
jgi:3-methyl-2-oxobutanoate hydroxymethyltransferase